GPYDITINSNVNEIKIVNILIGDIWLAGGQSNMEWFVEASLNAEEEIKNANYPNIRIFDVPHKMSSLPQENFEGGEWYEVTPNSIEQFSAVGYYFGRNIYQNINIPIGIIGNNWGGTVVQTWMSPKAFAGLSKYEKEIAKLKKVNLEKESQKSKTQFDSWLGDFYNLDQGIKNDKYIWAQDDMDYSSWKEMRLPQVWELSGDTALFEKDGVVWFQRSFDVGNIDDEKEIKLSLGAIDDSDKTWINGELVGEMYNRYNKNRVYKIEKGILKQGKNSIVVRVEDYTGAGGFTADKSDFFISIGEQKINLTGLWHYKIGMQPKTPLPKNIFGPNIFPTLLYNGMIYPMKDFPIKGVIWYQGESNVYNAFEYRELFKRWIKDWRAVWHNPQLPFIWVQIANFGEEQLQPKESTWAELREAQEMALELPNTKMITSIDIGEGK
ncbi:MAG: 9-O-acetylesterase, partial [Bacteroidia bacterium]